MRITDKSTLDESLLLIQRGQERLAITQKKAASGQKVDRPSDDPAAHGRIQAAEDQIVRLDGYNRNISLVRSRLSATEATLQSTEGLLSRFRELTMMALNQVTATPSIPIEAEQVYGQLVSLANQSYQGDFLFGGLSGTAPFAGTRFVGDNQKRAVEVSPLGATVFGISATEAFSVLPGQDVFSTIADAVAGMKTSNRAQIAAGLSAVDQHLQQLATAFTKLGSQQNALSTAEKANLDYSFVLEKAASNERDINPAQVYSQLAADRYAMESTFAVLGSTSRLSILKYL